MISKELLSVVLNKKVIEDDISSIELKDNKITFIEDYWDEDEGSGFYRSHTINIYELIHLCKEWLLNQNISAYSYLHELNGGVEIVPKKKCNWLNGNKKFKADTEPEAIFKAAQWVLDNTSTNKLKGH